jgi:hypothetical protein
MKMRTHRSYDHPLMVLINNKLSLQARCLYQILATNVYSNLDSYKIEDLLTYFKEFTEESDEKIREYIIELVEEKLLELE